VKRLRPREWLTCEVCGEGFLQLRWRGYEQLYCSRACANRKRPKTTWLDKHGYPQMTVDGRGVPIHRVVMERMLGRKLLPGETVHHKDGDRTNYAESNLELWTSRHGRGQRLSDLEKIGLRLAGGYATTAGDLAVAALSLGG
jgi:hypothetical protein